MLPFHPGKSWGHSGLSRILPHKDLHRVLPYPGDFAPAKGWPVGPTAVCSWAARESCFLPKNTALGAIERTGPPGHRPAVQSADGGTSGLCAIRREGDMKHGQVRDACGGDGVTPGGGGAPAEAWKASPKNASFGKSRGPRSHRGAGPATGRKDVNVTSS